MVIKFSNVFFDNVAKLCNSLGYRISMFVLIILRVQHVFFRKKEIMRQLRKFVLGGLPLVVVTSLFSGLIIAFQTGVELERFQQAELIGFIVATSMCKEMGPVFTAIALTGLLGAAVAAELASMKVNEEVDALEVMAIDPVSFLLLPRFIAFIVTLPVQTVVADVIGITTGAVIADIRFGVPFQVYFRNARDILSLSDVYGGLIKAIVFGILIAVIASSNGMRARYGAEDVGNATLKTVVAAFLFILLFDHLLNFVIYYI
ncbi:MAG: ABC transporter permease [Planctomycetes bacterium]|nr:ABC transporter permease [Planctomycetota bacterium]